MIKSNVLKKRGYSHNKAALLMHCAEIAYDYEGHNKSQMRLKELGFDKVAYIDNKVTDTQVHISFNDHAIVIAFRGSKTEEGQEAKDWDTNFNYRLTKINGVGHGHSGMIRAVQSVIVDIMQILRSIPHNESKDIFVTGHSLGGGNATIFSGVYGDEIPIEEIYTFGAPRVFDKWAAEYFNKLFPKSAFRFVNGNDIVCRVPLAIQAFRHCGQFMLIKGNGKVKKKASKFEYFRERIKGIFFDIPDMLPFYDDDKGKTKYDANWVEDHYPKYYYDPLSKLAGSEHRMINKSDGVKKAS